MIEFDNWVLRLRGALFLRQYDNLATIAVLGDIPEGWTWTLLVECGGNLNLISLTPIQGGLTATLSADDLSLAGRYAVQLKGVQGEKVRHTCKIYPVVPSSLSGDAKWPALPTEFSQAEERVLAGAQQAEAAQEAAQAAQKAAEASAVQAAASAGAAEEAKAAAQTAQGGAEDARDAALAARDQGPEIREGTWWLYDPAVGAYVDTGEAATGPAATIEITQVETAQPGAPAAMVELEGSTPQARKYRAVVPEGQPGQDAPQIDDSAISAANPWSSKQIVDTLAPPFAESGPIVTCNPVANYPLSVQVQINPVQEGSGDPSPENVRPINGWIESNLVICGENLLDLNNVLIGYLVSSDVGQYETKIIGESVYWGGKKGSSGGGQIILRCPTNVPLTIKMRNSIAGASGYIFECDGVDDDNTIINCTRRMTFSHDKEVSIIYTPTKPYMGFSMWGEEIGDVISRDLIVYMGSEDKTYTPYNPASKTIALPFGQTVYGGELDWTTGVLTVTHGLMDMTHLSQVNYKTENAVSAYSVNEFKGIADKSIILGDKMQFVAWRPSESAFQNAPVGWYAPTSFGIIGSFAFFGVSSNATDTEIVNAINQYLDSLGVIKICYQLRIPITIQLTPQEILALSGINNIYADTGDVTVSGRADPNAVINNLAQRIAALESAATGI